jgi:predicted aspartyl protease
MAADKTGPIVMTGTHRRDLMIGAGAFVCLAKILRPTVLANAAEAEGSADSRIISGSEAIVPVSVEAGEVIVDVSLNGRGPFPLIFDTGAEDAVTPEVAAALGLKTEGAGTVRDSGGGSLSIAFARVAGVRVGGAEMTDQRFAVLPLPRHVTDRGNRPPIAGFIGYELLTRFAARLDYDDSTLTLKPGTDFRYKEKGVRVPFTLAGNTAVVPGAADGIEGRFVVDTGSTGALTLRRVFVEDHGLNARHPSTLRIKSIGAAGPFETILMRLDRFDIAGSWIERPATRFASTGQQGLPFTDVDGSIGYEILRQFVITFDYRRGELWFERSSAFGTRTGQGGAGFQAVRLEGAGFGVTTVLPNTAAAVAGLEVDDVITEVDGLSTVSMSQGEFAERMRRPVGTLVRLGTIRDGMLRPIALTLKDVLP